MAAASPTFPSTDDSRRNLIKLIQSHEVAIGELSNLASSRAVYQRNGNIYFRTTTQKATASERKQLDLAKTKLEKAST